MSLSHLDHERQQVSDAVQSCLQIAKLAGASAVAARANIDSGLSVTSRMNEVETLEHHRGQSLSVSVYQGQHKGSASTSALSDEAIREAESDILEGADIIMVKPAGPYMDIIRRLKDEFNIPLAAYQVSGEYAIIKAGGKMDWIDEERVMLESLLGIKRAGADLILTYFAKDVAKLLND